MRLLSNQEWFEPVSSEGQFEVNFEDLVVNQADVLFPDYHTATFKTPVESEEGRRIPDLALVDRAYRYWWVVEIEMAHHSLFRHVIPQVEVFSRGKYGERHCDYLSARNSALNYSLLSDMIKGAQPRVLVVVNQSVPKWIEPIRRLDGIVTIVEAFRSHRNQHILRVNGDYPSVSDTNLISACRLDSVLPTLLRIDSPAGLGVSRGESLTIRLEGRLTNWSRLDTAEAVWLAPRGRNPLVEKEDYLIVKDSEGNLSFEKPKM